MVWDISYIWKRRMGIVAKKEPCKINGYRGLKTVTGIKMGTFVKKNKLK